MSIFSKSYDLRWIYWTDIDENLFKKLWEFFWYFLKWQNIAIGYDARLSSPSLKNSIIESLNKFWKNTIEIWLCSTDMLTFSTGYFDSIDWWIMITASHNPKEYNWLKVCLKNAFPVSFQNIEKQILKFFDNSPEPNWEKWTNSQKNITQERINHIISFVDKTKIKPLKIVVDWWNWSAGVFIETLLKNLNCEIVPLFLDPDWNFPNHEANPIKPENTKDLVQKVKQTWADLWVAFDWDADRMMICDENWDMLSWTITTAIIAENILQKRPWSKIIFNTVCGKIASETIKKNWWIPIRSKVWHAYIKEMMKNDPEIVFAGEHSAHYFFKNNRNADSASIALAIILEIISAKKTKVSDIRKYYDKYFSIHETNFKTNNSQKILQILKNTYWNWKISEEDWLLIEFDQRRFNVRSSSNEPLLRLNLEWNTQEIMLSKFQEIQKTIENNL